MPNLILPAVSMNFPTSTCIYQGCNLPVSKLFNIANSVIIQFKNNTPTLIKQNAQYSANLNKSSNIGLCTQHQWLNEYIEFTQYKQQDRLNLGR